MSKICVYACGGCGLNLVNPLEKLVETPTAGFAEINPVYIDTSKSNLAGIKDSGSVYLVEGLDGSGKKRDANYGAISESVKEILHQYKPSDLNIVVHSASGGSGSVIGPLLVSELLDRGQQTVVIVVGSSDSRIEAKNTVNTLKSYEVISNKRETPVIAVYHENGAGQSRGEVDGHVRLAITLLAAFFSGQNAELDSKDLEHFLNFPKVTSYEPALTFLAFFTKVVKFERGQLPVAIATLTDAGTDASVGVPLEYHAVGFIPPATRKALEIDLPVHAVAIGGYFTEVLSRLEEKIKAVDEQRATVKLKTIVSKSDESTDTGLVL
jgi:hypothetical protein